MPYKTVWTEPEVFMEHKGVVVFCTYKDNDFDNGAETFEFTLNKDNDEPEHRFDVHDLAVPSAKLLDTPPAPFLSESDERFIVASPEKREEFRQIWRAWYDGGQDQAIKRIICEAIDANIRPFDADLKLPVGHAEPNEDKIADFLCRQIEDGVMSLESIPTKMAQYGLMKPHEFVAEMAERMELAKGDDN